MKAVLEIAVSIVFIAGCFMAVFGVGILGYYHISKFRQRWRERKGDK